jgi:hypothetical protein
MKGDVMTTPANFTFPKFAQLGTWDDPFNTLMFGQKVGDAAASVFRGSDIGGGVTGNVSVNSTTTLAAGANATVSENTPWPSLSLDFGIPAGADGSQGAPGVPAGAFWLIQTSNATVTSGHCWFNPDFPSAPLQVAFSITDGFSSDQTALLSSLKVGDFLTTLNQGGVGLIEITSLDGHTADYWIFGISASGESSYYVGHGQTFNYIFKGPDGANGTAATVNAGNTTTGAPGSGANVTNSGNTTAAIFDFTIPAGADGADGTAATVNAGNTTTGAPGSGANVTNSGNTTAAIFDFLIPAGADGSPGTPGADGSNGTAATVSVGNTTTGFPGTSASVTNSGTSSAAILDFDIPRGDVGETGPNDISTTTTTPMLGVIIGAATTLYTINTAVDGTYTVGIGATTNGQITIQSGLVTAVVEAS